MRFDVILNEWFKDRGYSIYSQSVGGHLTDFVNRKLDLVVDTKLNEDSVLTAKVYEVDGSSMCYKSMPPTPIGVLECHVGDPEFFNKLAVLLDGI
jgi:hypothetical protein